MNIIASKRANIASVLIFVLCASVFMIFSNGHYGGDGLENYLTAESIVLDGDTAIHDRPFGVDEMNYKTRGNKDEEGSYYSDYGIGMPVLLVPFFLSVSAIVNRSSERYEYPPYIIGYVEVKIDENAEGVLGPPEITLLKK